MPFEIVTVPCLSDNYAFLLHSAQTGETALIDAPEAGPVIAALDKHNWKLTEIWLTHHHWDHIDAVGELKEATGAQVIGAKNDAHRLPPLNHALAEGTDYKFANNDVQIFDVSGHTVGHIAFYVPNVGAVFTADSLMALGCGRVFEGTTDQMWASLSKLAALPPDTIVYSGHEYTANNAKFAITIEPDNKKLLARVRDIEFARQAGKPTVPSSLQEELETNPFLRAKLPQVKSALAMQDASDSAVFAEIRRRKDAF
ncbi:MAG: hydroxyacylglutathione hydrolase [Paracoccaceae bacterium]